MIQRPRRLRNNPVLREMLRETDVRSEHLIYPLFVKEGLTRPQAVKSMPGVFQWPLKEIAREAADCWKKGIKAILLFGIPTQKDLRASQAISAGGIVQQAVKAIKEKTPDLFVITDVCLCEYMSHGHCGIVNAKGHIENDSTLELLAQAAASHVRAGADMVAPSDMMDGRVAAIRRQLDGIGFTDTPIMSYAVKYASAFYGPFRDAAESVPQFGDRRGYQMDGARVGEALREAALDEAEGADLLIVKPALPYLDIIAKVAAKTHLPVVGYQVSGEYSQIKAAASKGWLDEKAVVAESLIAIRRAGAQLVITYFAKEFLK